LRKFVAFTALVLGIFLVLGCAGKPCKKGGKGGGGPKNEAKKSNNNKNNDNAGQIVAENPLVDGNINAGDHAIQIPPINLGGSDPFGQLGAPGQPGQPPAPTPGAFAGRGAPIRRPAASASQQAQDFGTTKGEAFRGFFDEVNRVPLARGVP